MAHESELNLDFELAWRRARADTLGRVFIRDDLAIDLVQVDLEGWLGELTAQVSANRYTPSPALTFDVPKVAACVGVCLSLSSYVPAA